MQTILRPAYGTYTVTDDELADKHAVWGARLIAPADLVWDRQDIDSDDDAAKAALVDWLNGGAIREALNALREYRVIIRGNEEDRHTIFEDETGIIVGSAQASYGYVYVLGWLK